MGAALVAWSLPEQETPRKARFAAPISTMRVSTVTLCEQLKDMIEGHLERWPNTSINALASRSSVGASTLRRILSLSIKGDPSPHTVLNIVSAVTKERRLGKLLAMVEGPVGELLQDSFAAYVETDAPHEYDADLNHVLRDPMKYFIYKLAANRSGTDSSHVQELYGKIGLEKLADLCDLGLIEEKDEKFHATKKDFGMDIEIVAGHLPELVSFYKPHQVKMGKNLFYTLSESLNEDGIDRIKEIQREAVKKIYDVMRSPFYEGDIPYFTVNLSDTLDAEGPQGVLQ